MKAPEDSQIEGRSSQGSAFKIGMIGGIVFVGATILFDRDLPADGFDLVVCHLVVILLACVAGLLTRVPPSIRSHHFFGQLLMAVPWLFLVGAACVAVVIARDRSVAATLLVVFEVIVWVVVYVLTYHYAPQPE